MYFDYDIDPAEVEARYEATCARDEMLQELKDKSDAFDNLRDRFKDLIEEIYGDADTNRIEDILEEMADYFEMRLPKKSIPLVQDYQ